MAESEKVGKPEKQMERVRQLKPAPGPIMNERYFRLSIQNAFESSGVPEIDVIIQIRTANHRHAGS